MLPRIWIALLALLLVAASADGTSAEPVDAQSSISLCDDAATAHVQVVAVERIPDRIVCAARRADALRPAPAVARVFRPPRPPVA